MEERALRTQMSHSCVPKSKPSLSSIALPLAALPHNTILFAYGRILLLLIIGKLSNSCVLTILCRSLLSSLPLVLFLRLRRLLEGAALSILSIILCRLVIVSGRWIVPRCLDLIVVIVAIIIVVVVVSATVVVLLSVA